MARFPIGWTAGAVFLSIIAWTPAGAQTDTTRLTVHADRPYGDAYERLGDFMKLEMVFEKGTPQEYQAYNAVGFTGEKTAAFFSPIEKDEGYNGIVVTVDKPRTDGLPASTAPSPLPDVDADLYARVRIHPEGFKNMMEGTKAVLGRHTTTFNLNEMPPALQPPECVQKVGAAGAPACSPSDLTLWRIAVYKALLYVHATLGINVQVQLYGEPESRTVYVGKKGARQLEEYTGASPELGEAAFLREEEEVSKDYFDLAAATAQAFKEANAATGSRHIVTLLSPGVFNEQHMREICGGQQRNGMQTFLRRVREFNAKHPQDTPLRGSHVAMGVQLYNWPPDPLPMTREIAELGNIHKEFGYDFYVYGYNQYSETTQPHMNAAYIIAGTAQMAKEAPFIKEAYGYTWSLLGDDPHQRSFMYSEATGANAFYAGYQAISRVRGVKGMRFATVTQEGPVSDELQHIATVDPQGNAYLLIANNGSQPRTVAIALSGMPAGAQQTFYHIGPSSDGQHYSTRGLDDKESATFPYDPQNPMTLPISPGASLLVRSFATRDRSQQNHL